MTRRTQFAILLSASTLAATGCSQRVGKPAPAISSVDRVGAPDARPLSLADYRGRAVLLEFWATW